jgi:hypothetical protein
MKVQAGCLEKVSKTSARDTCAGSDVEMGCVSDGGGGAVSMRRRIM